MQSNQGDSQLRAVIDQAFSQPIVPPRKSFLYHLGLFLVTIVMILLPLIYFLLVVAAGWGVYFHATHDYTLMSNDHIPGRLRFLIYVGPLVIGSVLVLFLLMPFMPRKKQKYVPLCVVDPTKEPLFVYFVNKVCDCVNAPRPRQIEFVMQPNAAARFHQGWFGFMGGGLELELGLPLISGLTIPRLAGVLAHEFGHFRQGGGMRLHYIIGTVHSWFAQCVYEDSWIEEKLREASEVGSTSINLILFISHLFIWLTRRLLWLFMMFGTAISCFLSRQMEYDADQCEIRAAGSRDFETTMYIISTLNVAFEQTYHMSMASWQKRVLVNDLPTLAKVMAKELLTQKKDDVVDTILTDNTKLWDTHPSPRDRITQARKQNDPGACHIEGKSRDLFQDYPLLCKELTWTFFEKYFETGQEEKRFLSVHEYRQFLRQIAPVSGNQQTA